MQIASEPVHFQVQPIYSDFNGIAIREDVLFSNVKGEPNPKSRKQAEKLLNKLQDALRLVLEKDEHVFLIVKAQSPLSAVEQLTMSWVMYGLFQCVLVVTERRLLHFNINRDGSWSQSIKQLRWSDVRTLKVSGGFWGRNLKITYADGKSESYTRIASAAGKKMKAVLPWIKEHAETHPTPGQRFEHLCPECVSPLTDGVYACSRCGTTFKNERTLLRRLLLIPGGGYFYCRLKTLGLLVGFIESIFLLDLLFVLIEAPSAFRTGGEARENTLFACIGLLFLIGIDKAVAYLHCKKFIREFMVESKKPMGQPAIA